jgi:hypothetical protein
VSRNTFSVILALFFTGVFSWVSARLIFGPFGWDDVLISLFGVLPVYTILFALFYLFFNKFLPSQNRFIKPIQKRKHERPDADPDICSYRLSKEYILIGIIILTVCLIGVFWISDELSIIFLILIITHLATNPYRVDLLEDDSLLIYRIFRKKKIKISEIKSVFKGPYRDKIVLKDDYVYFNHLISNISGLTDIIAAKIEPAFPLKSTESVKLAPSKSSEVIFIIILIVLFAILSSIFIVFYMKEFVKSL